MAQKPRKERRREERARLKGMGTTKYRRPITLKKIATYAIAPIVLGGLLVAGIRGYRAHRIDNTRVEARQPPSAPYNEGRTVSNPTTKSTGLLPEDTVHTLTGTFQSRYYRTPRVGMVFEEPRNYCMTCHSMTEISSTEATRLFIFFERIKAQHEVHSNIKDALVTFTPRKTNLGGHLLDTLGTASYQTGEVKLGLSAAAHPFLREFMLPHEIFHFSAQQPDHLVKELWANISPLWIQPELFGKIGTEKTASALVTNNGYFLNFFNRAAILSGKARTVNPYNFGKTGVSIDFHRGNVEYIDGLRSSDIKQASEVYKRAFREYSRNSIYWESVLSYLPDQNVIPDVFVARELYAKSNPEFLNERNNQAEIEENRNLILQSIKEIGRNQQLRRELQQGIESYAPRIYWDLKLTFFQKYGQKLPARAVEMKYLAALHSIFIDERGNINYAQTATADLLTKIAEVKVEVTDSALAVAKRLVREVQRLENAGKLDSNLASAKLNALRARIEVIENRRKDLLERINGNRFIQVDGFR